MSEEIDNLQDGDEPTQDPVPADEGSDNDPTEKTDEDRQAEEALVELLSQSDDDEPSANLLGALGEVPETEGAKEGQPEALVLTAEQREELKRILRIKVPFEVVLARKNQSLYETINLQVGSLIEFDKMSDEQLDIYVNNEVIGTGEVVKIQEKFGVRVKSIAPVSEKIRKLGK